MAGFTARDGSEWQITVGTKTGDEWPVLPLSADEPLIIEADDDEALYTPIRATRLRISVVASINGLPAATSQRSHPISVTRDGTTVWRGWLTMDNRSQDFSTAITAIEIDAQSGTSLLDAVDFDGGSSGTIDLWSALWQAAKKSGGVDRITLPASYRTFSAAMPREVLSSLSLQCAEFDDGTGDPDTWQDVLNAVMTFMGWTLWDKGNIWEIVDIDHSGAYYDYANASADPVIRQYPSSLQMLPAVAGSEALAYRGDGHKITRLQAYGTFRVTTDNDNTDSTDEIQAKLDGCTWSGDNRGCSSPAAGRTPRKDNVGHWANGTQLTFWNHLPITTNETQPRQLVGKPGGLAITCYRYAIDPADPKTIDTTPDVPMTSVYTAPETTPWTDLALTADTDCTMWSQSVCCQPFSKYLDPFWADMPEGKSYFVGAVPMYVAKNSATLDNAADPPVAWDTYYWDFKPTIRLVMHQYVGGVRTANPAAGRSGTYRLKDVYCYLSIKAPARAIPQRNTVTGDGVLLDIRMDMQAVSAGVMSDWFWADLRAREHKPSGNARMHFALRIGNKWYYEPSRRAQDGTPPFDEALWMDEDELSESPIFWRAIKIDSSNSDRIYPVEPSARSRVIDDGLDDVTGFAALVSADGAPTFGDIEVRIYPPYIESQNAASTAGQYYGEAMAMDLTGISLAFVTRRAKTGDTITIDGKSPAERAEDEAEADGTKSGEWTLRTGEGEEYETVEMRLTGYERDRAPMSTATVISGGEGLQRLSHVALGQDTPAALLLKRLSAHYARARKLWELDVEAADMGAAAGWAVGTARAITTGATVYAKEDRQTLTLQEI